MIQYPNIPPEHDRRRKLTDDERAEIYNLRDEFSQRYLAKKFGVSRRTIQFIIDPKNALQTSTDGENESLVVSARRLLKLEESICDASDSTKKRSTAMRTTFTRNLLTQGVIQRKELN